MRAWDEIRQAWGIEGRDVRGLIVWDDVAGAAADADSAAAVLDDPEADPVDVRTAEAIRPRAMGTMDALVARQDGRTTVSLPGWVRDALAAQSTHRDVVSYVSQHVDPQQEFCGLPPDRDEIVQRIVPWYAAVWRDLAASNGRALLEHLARMVADWPEQQRDLRELAPLVQAMYRAWSAFRAAGVERTPAFRAVGWDIVRWHQVTGVPKPRGLRRHATITSAEARAEHRLATRHGRDAAAQLKQQHNSAAAAERQQPGR